METKRTIPYSVLLGYVCLAVSLLGLYLRMLPYASDDAYIHFRIADHLLHAGVPYFNLDEPVKGSSSSAWTLFLSGVFALTGTHAEVVAILNALIVALGAFVYVQLIQALAQRRLPLVLYWLFPVSYMALTARAGIGLMETPLALLFFGTGLSLLHNKQPYGCIFLTASIFVRLELSVLVSIMLLYALMRSYVKPLTALVYVLIGCVPFLGYDLYFFQTVIPNTVIAKSIVYDISYWMTVLQVLHLLWPSTNSLVLVFVALMLTCTLFLIAYSLFIHGRALRVRQLVAADNIGFVYLLLLGGLMIAAAYIAARTFVFGWYLPLFTVPIFVALYGFTAQRPSRVNVLLLALIIFSLMCDLTQTVVAAGVNPAWYPDFEAGARVRTYLRVGAALFQRYPTATLMTSEIGGLGYSFRGHIDDGAGLVSPRALHYHPMRVPEERSLSYLGAIPVGYIEEMRPEIIVSYDFFIEAFLRSEVVHEYTRLTTPVFLPEDQEWSGHDTLLGSKYLNIFIRKDMADTSNPGISRDKVEVNLMQEVQTKLNSRLGEAEDPLQ